jgi:ferredoxin-NADP reductase
VITALILGFIFTPTMQPLGLGILALIAVIAMASKFVLAYRGRHIFNPAAIAAVLIGLTGIVYASWWVATPLVLPVVALGGFLTLYKTRRLLMGGIFLAVAVTLIVLQGVLIGDQFSAVVGLALVSYPLVFFAGYMLSEPLTLPPRRWQTLALAALAGVVVAVPFEVGALSGSPQVALILVNVIAFFAGQRKGIRLTLQSINQVTPTVKEFIFQPKSPLRYASGQYIELQLSQPKPDNRGTRRSFSIIGLPGEETFRLALKYPEKPSSFKQSLAALQPGSTISATRISGDFVLPKNTAEPLLFVAGGIGITPFVSFMNEIKDKNLPAKLTLVYAVAHTDELAYIDTFVAAGARVIVVSREDEYIKAGVEYIQAEYLTPEVLKATDIDFKSSRAYVSGPPIMVDATIAALKKSGSKAIHRDYFNGY